MKYAGDPTGKGEVEPYLSVIQPVGGQSALEHRQDTFKAVPTPYIPMANGEKVTLRNARRVLLPKSLRKDGVIAFGFGVKERDLFFSDTLLSDQVVEIDPEELKEVGTTPLTIKKEAALEAEFTSLQELGEKRRRVAEGKFRKLQVSASAKSAGAVSGSHRDQLAQRRADARYPR